MLIGVFLVKTEIFIDGGGWRPEGGGFRRLENSNRK